MFSRFGAGLFYIGVPVSIWLAIGLFMHGQGVINSPPFPLVLGEDFKLGAVTLNVRAPTTIAWAGDVSDPVETWPIKIVGADDWRSYGIEDLVVYPRAVQKTVMSPGQKVNCVSSGVDREICRSADGNAHEGAPRIFRPSYAIGPHQENEYQRGRDGAYLTVSRGLCEVVFLDLAAGRVSGTAKIDCQRRHDWPALADKIEAQFATYIVRERALQPDPAGGSRNAQ